MVIESSIIISSLYSGQLSLNTELELPNFSKSSSDKCGANGASNFITLADGDIVYGAFDAVDINGTTKYIVAYIGK